MHEEPASMFIDLHQFNGSGSVAVTLILGAKRRRDHALALSRKPTKSSLYLSHIYRNVVRPIK